MATGALYGGVQPNLLGPNRRAYSAATAALFTWWIDSRTVTGGTYTLLVELPNDATIEVGALGSYTFSAGWYAYTGSALGAGGFSRVGRHHDLAAGGRDTRHWHVDYLLGHPESLADDVRTVLDAECEIARRLPDAPVDGFGASDCDCRSHLAYSTGHEPLNTAVREAHRSVR